VAFVPQWIGADKTKTPLLHPKRIAMCASRSRLPASALLVLATVGFTSGGGLQVAGAVVRIAAAEQRTLLVVP